MITENILILAQEGTEGNSGKIIFIKNNKQN